MLRVSNNIAPTIINDLFTRSHHSYDVHSKFNFVFPVVCTVHNGQNSVQYYGPLIWNIIPDYMKNSNTLCIFKSKILKWETIKCLCRLWKKYKPNLRFINQI